MWKKWRGWLLAGMALTTYLLGGIGVIIGLVLIGIVGEQDLWGWGQANSIGYLCFGVGLCLTILGVLVMRVMRNRQIA
jgi:MFS family permease